MKPLSKLTKEELIDLLFYNNGTRSIPYSTVTSFNEQKRKIEINGVEYLASSPDAYQRILDGKIRYEHYRLQYSQKEIEQLLQTQAESIFEHKFEQLLSAKVDEVSSLIQTATDKLKNVHLNASTLQSVVTDTSKAIADFTATHNISDINKKLQSKLDDLTSTNQIVDKSKQEFDEVIAKLKGLFN